LVDVGGRVGFNNYKEARHLTDRLQLMKKNVSREREDAVVLLFISLSLC
jgi:hypothetical protein